MNSTARNSIRDFLEHSGRDLNKGKSSYSVDQAAAQLIRDDSGWRDVNGDGVVSFGYNFVEQAPVEFVQFESILGKFSAFNSQQRTEARLAMQSWEDVANVKFEEVAAGSEEGHVRFHCLT